VLTVCTKTGLQEARAKVLIDATGDANVVSLAGYDVMRPPVVQPATLSVQCSGYDAATLDFAALKAAAEKAIAAGELVTTDISWFNRDPRASSGTRWQCQSRSGAGSGNERGAVGRGSGGAPGRTAGYRFLRKQPGLEKINVDSICPKSAFARRSRSRVRRPSPSRTTKPARSTRTRCATRFTRSTST